MSLLNPIISLLFTAYSHPRSFFTSCELVSSYVKFVIDMRENTLQVEDKGFRISRGSVHILRNGTKHVPNALMRHTNTNGCRASRFKAYVKCIRTPSPREKDCGRSVKSMAKENKHFKEICFAKVVRNPIGLHSAFCLEKVSTNVAPQLFEWP